MPNADSTVQDQIGFYLYQWDGTTNPNRRTKGDYLDLAERVIGIAIGARRPRSSVGRA